VMWLEEFSENGLGLVHVHGNASPVTRRLFFYFATKPTTPFPLKWFEIVEQGNSLPIPDKTTSPRSWRHSRERARARAHARKN
jgi:hypothetical protein